VARAAEAAVQSWAAHRRHHLLPTPFAAHAAR
jgi:hypothetical protein